MKDFEIYKAYQGRKSYIVGGINAAHSEDHARKYYKTTKEHIRTFIGFIYRGELYLQDPEKKGTRAVWVSTWNK